jgi:hypothetical protein
MRETRIAAGDYLAQTVRGVLVYQGQILVTTTACRQGALVEVNPKTGSQTPLVRGFRITMGLAAAPKDDTVLVADENSGNGEFGRLYELDIARRERTLSHIFQTSEAAKSIAVHPLSGAIFYAAGDVYGLEGKLARRMDIENVRNIQALTFSSQGEMYVAGYEGVVAQVRPRSPVPMRVFAGLPSISTWSIATSRDGRYLFVGSGGGESGRVFRINLSNPEAPPEEVWKGRRGGLGVFLAVAN